jgi:alginate O-acetyltransferase complex protein AlgI
MTLGAWMRNYLYIPLGGNRVSDKRLYFNLWFVFLASGLWHGASWSFVVWGAYHGVFLVLERAFLLKVYDKLGKFFSTFITFLLVVIGWVFFRIEKLPDAFAYLGRMFAFQGGNPVELVKGIYIFFGLAAFFAFFTYLKPGKKIQDAVYFNDYPLYRHFAVGVAAMLMILQPIHLFQVLTDESGKTGHTGLHHADAGAAIHPGENAAYPRKTFERRHNGDGKAKTHAENLV